VENTQKQTIFINPPSEKGRKLIRNFDCATESKGNYLYQPYDLLLLSSHFDNHEFELIDAIAEGIELDEVLTKVNKLHVQCFIVALADTNWSEDYNFVKILNEKFPNIPLFVFGDAFIDKQAIKHIKGFSNGVIANPLEICIKDLKIESPKDWVSKQGFVQEDTYSRADLKKPTKVSINMPKHDRFLLKSYRWPFSRRLKYTTVFTAWGCPYSCSYCVVAKFPNIYRDYKEILTELDYVKSIGLKEIYMGDRSFGLPRNNTIDLLKGMIERDYKFTWSTYFHPNQYDPELLKLMKESGCHTLIIGIESHDFKSLKKFGRHMKEDRFYKLLDHARELGIDICGDFIIGLPNETREDILKTIHLAKTIKIDYASFNIAAPLAGSSLRENAKIDGRIKEGEENHFDSFGFHKVLSNGVLSGEEILELRNKAVREFYLNPKYLFKSIFRIHSLEHLYIQVQEMIQILFKTK